jgi:hypothetical protein
MRKNKVSICLLSLTLTSLLVFTKKTNSFGLILWEVWTRGVLFAKYDDFKPFIRAVTLDHERPPIPADARPCLSQLMEVCLFGCV